MHSAMGTFVAFRSANVELVRRLHAADPDLASLCQHLAFHVGERHQAATVLVQGAMLWDAEIVLRSASEAAVKVLFLCLADQNERAARIVEFTEGLNAIADIKQSERAATRLEHMAPDAPDRFIFESNVLDEATLASLRTRWPRKDRKRLNAKWSYTEMVAWVANWMHEKGGSEAYKLLMHGYGISSHFIHADHRSLDLVADRRGRREDVRRAQEVAHVARLTTDMLLQCSMIGVALLHANGIRSTASMDAAVSEFHRVLELTERFQQAFREAITPVEGGSSSPA